MAQQDTDGKAPSVFVSYAHESDKFRASVKKLCTWLRKQGVNLVCDFDYPDMAPPLGWTTWMQHGIEDASVVLVIASPKYKARFEKRAPPTSGKGVAWEGAIINADLYNSAQRNEKFFPILPDGGSHSDVPAALQPWLNGHHFPSGMDGILRLIRECQRQINAQIPPAQKTLVPLDPIKATAIKTMTKNRAVPVIVLMTVNDNETQALWNVFLGKGKTPTSITKGGTTYSELGVHGSNRLVHVICQMGASGVGASQQCASDAILHWKPKAVIAVGIAFGLDEKKQKIGDVLVAKQIQDYELSRLSKNGTLTPRADKPTSVSPLIKRLEQTDAEQKRTNSKWPKVRFGLVLSGQKLVDNLDYRESLKKLFEEAIGGEMEGSGLYASAHAKKTDWLVIKAICDWGYDKNSAMKDKWQKVAAKNAATVLKATLEGDGLYAAKSFAVSAESRPARALNQSLVIKPQKSIPLQSDAVRLAHARTDLQNYLGCDELKAVASLDFIDNLPKVVNEAFPAAKGKMARLAVAEKAMKAVVFVAKDYADYVGNLPKSSSVKANKKQHTAVRTRLINAMQTAILLSARQEKLLDGGVAAACDAQNPCELEVDSLLAAIVQLRLGKLAEHLEADLPEGCEPVWRDKGHLSGFDAVEIGLKEKDSYAGAQSEFLLVLHKHLYPKETKRPDFANNRTAVSRLLGEALARKGDGGHLLVFLEKQNKTLSSDMIKWMIENTHIGVVTLTAMQSQGQAVFELDEGIWTALLVRLFEALKPFEK